MSSALISSADASRIPIPAEHEDVAALRQSVVHKLTYAVGRDPIVATDWDWFIAAALAVRDHVLERWMASTRNNYVSKGKRVYYLSLEFLIGRLLHDSLNNLGLVERMRAALAELGVDYDRLRDIEHDAALGNGGLGRLAACFMESMATLSHRRAWLRHPLRSRHVPPGDPGWLAAGIPGELADLRQSVGVRPAGCQPSGRLRRHRRDPPDARTAARITSGTRRKPSTRSPTTRRWSAGADTSPTRCASGRRGRPNPLRLDTFNRGDHIGALAARDRANAISQVLYPSDETPAGQELRLRQEYFFTSASLQDLVERHMRQHNGDIRILPGQDRDPVERHASGDRRRRADAHPGRSARYSLGRGLADHRRRRSPIPTTRCCRRRWRAGRSR